MKPVSAKQTRARTKASEPAATAATPKLDLIKLHKADYVAPKAPVLLEIARAHYLAIDGEGAPSGPVFASRLSALYGMAFTIKMRRKARGLGDYTVSRLESIYDAESLSGCNGPDRWRWTILIRTPEFVGGEDIADAVTLLRQRGKEGDAGLVRLLQLQEGTCVQALHTGPYDREHETFAQMRDFAQRNGYGRFGNHHEIYISDPRYVEPAKLKTILRVPVSH